MMNSELTYFSLNTEEKMKLISKIKEILSDNAQILLALVFGSFIELDSFRDIDIAVYMPNLSFKHILHLSVKLENELGIPVDIVPLNELPSKFKYHILVNGKIIVEKRKGLYEALLSQTLDELMIMNELK